LYVPPQKAERSLAGELDVSLIELVVVIAIIAT